MMQILHTLRVFCLLAAASIVALGIFTAPASALLMKKEEFTPVISYVERLKGRTGRLPSPADFKAWKVDRGWGNRAIFLETHASQAQGSCESGPIPHDAYIVVVTHRGHDDCYFSWRTAFSFEDAMRDVWVALASCLLTALGLAFAIDFLQARPVGRE